MDQNGHQATHVATESPPKPKKKERPRIDVLNSAVAAAFKDVVKANEQHTKDIERAEAQYKTEVDRAKDKLAVSKAAADQKVAAKRDVLKQARRAVAEEIEREGG